VFQVGFLRCQANNDRVGVLPNALHKFLHLRDERLHVTIDIQFPHGCVSSGLPYVPAQANRKLDFVCSRVSVTETEPDEEVILIRRGDETCTRFARLRSLLKWLARIVFCRLQAADGTSDSIFSNVISGYRAVTACLTHNMRNFAFCMCLSPSVPLGDCRP
jgi:hypothetical protein